MGTYTKAQLETELTRIKNAVASCRTAIYNKGVTTIPSNVTLAQLPTYVNMIQCSHPDILLKWLGNGTSYSAKRADVYFDTGIYATAYTTFDAVFSRPVTGGDGMLFGADDSTSTSYFFIPYFGKGYIFWFSNWLSNSGNWRPSGTPSNVGNFVHLGFSKNPHNGSNYSYLCLDGSSYTKSLYSSSSTSSNTIYLFARNKGSAGVDCKAYNGTRIKFIKFIDTHTGQVLRFFIPVLHWRNGEYVPCFYDKVTDSYIYNLGTGTVSYESYDYKMCDSIYYNTRVTNTAYGFITNKTWASGDSIFAKTSAETLSGEQYICGWRKPDNGSYKFGLCWAAASFCNYYPTSGNSTGVVSSVKASAGNTYNLGSVITGSNYYRRINVNGTYTDKSTRENSNTTVASQKYFILGNNGSIYPNTRVYYASIHSVGYDITYNYIPILDGTTPKFIDLETGNKIAYNGSASAVSYDLLD